MTDTLAPQWQIGDRVCVRLTPECPYFTLWSKHFEGAIGKVVSIYDFPHRHNYIVKFDKRIKITYRSRKSRTFVDGLFAALELVPEGESD